MMSDNHNISDELLAAFLDGNTSAADTRRVLKAAQHDAQLQELIRIASLWMRTSTRKAIRPLSP